MENRNLQWSKRAKVPLILIFSVNTNHESVAYRSFSPSEFEARGARKVTTGINRSITTRSQVPVSRRGLVRLLLGRRANSQLRRRATGWPACRATHSDAGTSLRSWVPRRDGNTARGTARRLADRVKIPRTETIRGAVGSASSSESAAP